MKRINDQGHNYDGGNGNEDNLGDICLLIEGRDQDSSRVRHESDAARVSKWLKQWGCHLFI